jgi:SAM-dependent methyltransferase
VSLIRILAIIFNYELIPVVTNNSDPFPRYHSVGSASALFKDALHRWTATNKPDAPVKVIDLGSGDGKQVQILLAEVNFPFDLWSLDLEGKDNGKNIVHDICNKVQERHREQFDILYSYNAFEHFKNPLAAADNCAGMLRKNGICLIHTVFFMALSSSAERLFQVFG